MRKIRLTIFFYFFRPHTNTPVKCTLKKTEEILKCIRFLRLYNLDKSGACRGRRARSILKRIARCGRGACTHLLPIYLRWRRRRRRRRRRRHRVEEEEKKSWITRREKVNVFRTMTKRYCGSFFSLPPPHHHTHPNAQGPAARRCPEL